MSWRWLKPGEAPPRMDLSNFNFSRLEQQRRAAARAAWEMSARSDFLYHDTYDDGDSCDEFDSSEDFERECAAGIPYKLRLAVYGFNAKCEEDDTSFQWFDETIEGPLDVQEVRADHRKRCELCDRVPLYGEVYFTYNWAGPWDHSKLCQTCGTGVLHAALQAAEGYDDEDEDEGEEEEDASEDVSEDAEAGSDVAAQQLSKQPSRRQPVPPSPPSPPSPAAIAAAAQGVRRAPAAATAATAARGVRCAPPPAAAAAPQATAQAKSAKARGVQRTAAARTPAMAAPAAAAPPPAKARGVQRAPPPPPPAARGTRRQAAASAAVGRSAKRTQPSTGRPAPKPQPKKHKGSKA